MDIFSQRISADSFEWIAQNTRALIKPTIDDETARQINTKLAQSDHPVAYVGGGILLAKASEELADFVNHMELPVAHSLMGKGALRPDIRHHLTRHCGQSPAWPFLCQYRERL